MMKRGSPIVQKKVSSKSTKWGEDNMAGKAPTVKADTSEG